ncbi:uncharacterized protein PITG_02800 [Phytophthora infestans T30-4]|uniref:PHD-type domain-containing protein n=1 Tax=Phytophthora infestans (strain T30-4) TaxID=403677 RepID=D0MX93_PHYIT|nr:uncharacterized protein PITG_02800 [Phytophthora infestans T30-4]EEY64256.1 conserved hypothetical protein [Phytophthora infestans T30-4]|eukprot:XP_002907692.1 conserved hypothetical protein [Phytophthora infestans T30-4]
MTHVRIESGCMQKSVAKNEEDDSDDTKTSWGAKNGGDLLEPILAMAEESFETVNSLELKEAEARQTVEELVLAGERGTMTENVTDESVRVLDGWKQQLLHAQKESDVLSVEAPEQKVISLVISLLEWLQGSRSLFYDEILPLQDLRMLWPLSYLKTHEKVVLEWTERVHKCVADKHARVSELQTLLDSGSGLLLEQGTFKIVMDEAKKARVWLSKLKKRLRALITKGVGRMSLSAARSLVEEGEDIAIDMPVFDFLKEHLEIASDWETRVLASGIESGQARVANLLALLNEYECARLVIDLDMHRDVLKSATERYCICRQPFDGLMIGCDHCDDWFHDCCIGMSKEKAEKVERYTCPSCTILQELGAMLQHAKTAEKQNNLWDMQEYARAFEKHQASALRKVKREEKTVERTEMLLFSCNNQMNQLRARIDDIERAKACLSLKPVAGTGALGQQHALRQAPEKPSPVPTPQLLNPMAATLMGSTERLAALVVAGGVEQQLTKMKSEHVEASKQVLELQSSLRLSRERLANAQQALRELSDIFHARHRMLPYAQAWVRQAVTLLNTTTSLSRANIDNSTFLPREYATALSEMEHPPASASASSPTPTPESMGIDKLFPGVDMYARLLRTVPWSQVVVSLLQERPSRCEINDAIAYALEYGLWEDKKTVAPLRSVIGRVDAWVSRAHKCMTKSASKTQQLSRLKVLMNEYSKLPLTYARSAEPLEVYVKSLTGEAAAVKALDEAMQAPRKRKAYTRKEKAPARSTKKAKKSQGASGAAGSVSSSTNSAANVKVESTTRAAHTGSSTST